MSKLPETTQPKRNIHPRGRFFLPFVAILLGSFLLIIHEYLIKGRVSGITLGASALAFVIGLIILLVLGWHANKPEE
jgi:hypothetical protein